MPFLSINDPKLPQYIKNRDKTVRAKWISVFNSVFAKEGEKMAFLVANKWLKDSLTKRSTHVKKNEKLLMTRAKGGLTKRANGKASFVDLAGFPYHALDTYLPKLVLPVFNS